MGAGLKDSHHLCHCDVQNSRQVPSGYFLYCLRKFEDLGVENVEFEVA